MSPTQVTSAGQLDISLKAHALCVPYSFLLAPQVTFAAQLGTAQDSGLKFQDTAP